VPPAPVGREERRSKKGDEIEGPSGSFRSMFEHPLNGMGPLNWREKGEWAKENPSG